MADFMAAGDQSGCSDLSNAATAETCGHAIDVPESKKYEFLLAAKMLTPGAATSGCPAIILSHQQTTILTKCKFLTKQFKSYRLEEKF